MRSAYTYFGLFDFDGTVARTFEPSLNGVEVNQAYRLACGEVFGQLGYDLFDGIGGLRNRTAGELMAAIFATGDRTALIVSARKCLREQGSTLVEYVPPGRGIPLEWNNRQPLSVITELCLRIKLRILTAQIGMPCEDGSPWPNPCLGFVDLWRAMAIFSETSGSRVNFVPGIVSSGHDYFINRCFELWGLAAPQNKVTDDMMRSPLCNHIPACDRAKPRVGPVRVFCEQWLNGRGEHSNGDALAVMGNRGFYAGDCPRADGGLAENLGVPFLWFDSKKEEDGDLKGQVVQVNNWSDLISPLFSGKAIDMMGEGRSFAQIVDAVLV